MKKTVKAIMITAIAALLLAVTAVPAMAAEDPYAPFDAFFEDVASDTDDFYNNWNETNEKIQEKKKDILEKQKEIQEEQKEIQESWERMESQQRDIDTGAPTIVIILAVLLFGAMVFAIVYIFVEAPKCGMSRLWALVPLFSSILGLIIFITVRTNSKNAPNRTNTICCPTCNSVHPVGTTACSICGTTFQ